MKKYIIYTLLLFICPIRAQVNTNQWMEYIEELAEETENTEMLEALFVELSDRTQNPFDLNRVTREELKRLPFLSDQQIESLIAFREKQGEFVSIYELKNIPALDFQAISLIVPFVYVGEAAVDNLPITVDNLLKRGKNELIVRYDQGFQQKKGYRFQPDSILERYPNRKYLGEAFYHSVQYAYTFDERIQWGVVAEKDAGEPFWNKYHKGYDYYSGHLFLKEMGRIKSLAIGDYKVSFGQGLVISNDFMPGRNALVTQVERRNNGFRRHFSTNETDFFRGVATTLAWDRVEVSLFYSYRQLDAKLDSGRFTTLKTDGLHRTVGDWEKRRTLPMQTFGGNIRYVSPDLCVGLTALGYTFGRNRMEPQDQPYNHFYFRGSSNANVSVDYMIKNRRIKIYGETALSGSGAWASLNGLQFTPVSYISFLFLHRYYDKHYQSHFGSAFGQNSTVQNEQGVYTGLQLTPFPYWKLSMYADVFRFPWLKYGVDAPSSGKEYMVQLQYTPGDHLSAYIRYRYRQKEKNVNEEERTYTILPYTQQRLRFQLTYRFSPSVFSRSSVDGVFYAEEKKGRETHKGIMIAQSIGWKPGRLPLQGDLYLAWFYTDDYNTRISSYERNLLYSFYMPSFYGRGIRLAATFRWDILKHLSFSFKIAHTRYADRDLIGTGLEEIESKQKTDFYGNLKWKF
ncbi:helix-hairpin-helix domain-containing protein [Parabacteroides sp. PF5-6]|uniref:helix-hairpin-helix domain-containing protein n=1 Tax=Parabacteroides sp. PF5-6 TaxID=1742403 RepID=UPI00240538CD|nr:helix-hairpin-helix domain-containing protein [Parabacteroides sp. PF5-6]MDF9830475.1 hypothetical protein [Parabacteroides sp. PF5-6]